MKNVKTVTDSVLLVTKLVNLDVLLVLMDMNYKITVNVKNKSLNYLNVQDKLITTKEKNLVYVSIEKIKTTMNNMDV